ncbi:MAG: FAD:protein FMN transferase [Candidatus Moranbacteria bacterium]|nr:FAD:protein FMN transferase [Candidatus Moranbacteria bacterium]
MKSEVKSNFRALGTDINVCIVINDEAERKKAKKDIEEIENIYRAKQKIFCRFSAESELSRLNQNSGVFQKASPDILYLAGRALHYNEISGGLYDPRIIGVLEKIGYGLDFQKTDFRKLDLPEKFSKIEGDLSRDLGVSGDTILFKKRMDFSGIAKGYITDCAAEFLKKRGWKNFLIDSGGDMRIVGKNKDGADWKISIEGVPEEKLMLEITDRGIATSGISRKKWEIKGKKFHHLVNPKNPNHFSYELRTVSVISEKTEYADGRAKVLMLMGKERGLEFAKKNKTAAIFLDYKRNIFLTPEAKKYIN